MERLTLVHMAAAGSDSLWSHLFATVLPVSIRDTLVLLESPNDIGATEFLDVRTMTVSVYTTWVARSDLPGAAQIARAVSACALRSQM